MLVIYHITLLVIGCYGLKTALYDREAPMLGFAVGFTAFAVFAVIAVTGYNPTFDPSATHTSLGVAGIGLGGSMVSLVYLVLEWRDDLPETAGDRAKQLVVPRERGGSPPKQRSDD